MPFTILGGGIAGLYAALQLLDKGHTNITIYEARERLGGNIFTHYDKDFLLEAGAGRFNAFHKRLLKLLKRFQLTVYPLPKEKWFAPVLCPGKRMADPSYQLLQEVIEYANNFTSTELTQITFGQLADQALGATKAKLLINSFGYDAEFLVANAYASIQIFKEDFNPDTPYYCCTEGLSELVKRLSAYLLQNQVKIYTQWTVQDVLYANNTFKVKFYGHRSIKTTHLILALPSTYLQTFSLFTPQQQAFLDTVQPIPVHRIYAKETRTLPSAAHRTTTDLPLRQYIPIYPDKGIAMVSYSDLSHADYWKTYADQGIKKLNTQLQIQLKQLFPKDPPAKFEWVLSFYWKEGVHSWKAGVQPKQIRKSLKSFYPGLAIVGESYSLRQGWIEGALETVDDALPLLLQSPNQAGGKPLPAQWVKLTVPGETKPRIIDVTQWMYQHPGGPQPYLLNMHKDITNKFKNIQSHFDPTTKQLKPHVLKAIQTHTVQGA